MRTNHFWSMQLSLVAGSALALAAGGCSAPWRGSISNSDDMPTAETSAQKPRDGFERTPRVADGSLPTARPNGFAAALPFTDDTHQLDLSSVLDDLQRIRAIDPAAEQRLISQLRETPASSWQLVAEQFRASLAYREQVASKRQASHENDLFNDGRPSTPFGALTDPRHLVADGVSSEAMAASTPYSTPVPIANGARAAPLSIDAAVPAQFASDGPVYPIAAADSKGAEAPMADSFGAVAQAGFTERPKASASTGDWQRLVQMAAADLSRNAPASPTTTAEVHQLATLRILHLLSGDTDQAMEAIPHLSPTEQDYWSRQMFALATYLDHHAQPDDKRRAAASVMHLDEAVSSLRELGSLSLRNLSFCKTVHGYGAIESYDADRFSPGEQVSLYVEVENYHSQSTEKGYCTSLGSTYEILNEGGERVAGGAMPDVDDCCRSRRRDFHIQYGIAIPKSLAAGKYRLNLIVKDRLADKIGHSTVVFEILDAAP